LLLETLASDSNQFGQNTSTILFVLMNIHAYGLKGKWQQKFA
jgi:hypothetical protein